MKKIGGWGHYPNGLFWVISIAVRAFFQCHWGSLKFKNFYLVCLIFFLGGGGGGGEQLMLGQSLCNKTN